MKMQRALEKIVEDSEFNGQGLAYRRAWLENGVHTVVCLSDKSGHFNCYSKGMFLGSYMPTQNDVLASDWVYEL